ncbi:hypothetical protein SDC9_209617 [bioreactor metagenome]|uniref:Uncharacterized protein n=1 Tax=bioreactor metagenome TaxID=1076179 RepID=A0A645JF99_9ZZZZ
MLKGASNAKVAPKGHKYLHQALSMNIEDISIAISIIKPIRNSSNISAPLPKCMNTAQGS